MPRTYTDAGAVPRVEFDARFALASFYEDSVLGYWSSVNGRFGVLAKAVIDLNDQTAAETNRRFDRLETMLGEVKTDLCGVKVELGDVKADLSEIKADLGGVKVELGEVKADLGEVKADLGEVKTDLVELKSTVNRIDARLEQQAVWIARDEAKGRSKRH